MAKVEYIFTIKGLNNAWDDCFTPYIIRKRQNFLLQSPQLLRRRLMKPKQLKNLCERGVNEVFDIIRSFHPEWTMNFLEIREKDLNDALSFEVPPLSVGALNFFPFY